MPWFQGDDKFTTNPKARKLLDMCIDGDYRGLAAIGMWFSAGTDIQQSTMDGMISRAGLVRIALNPDVVDELAGLLVDAGFWHVAGHECDRCVQPPPGTFLFHDWGDFGYATEEEFKLKVRKAKELRNSRIRREVWARDCAGLSTPDEGDCRYCGRRVRKKNTNGPEESRYHLDHVDPMLTIGASNIVLCCGGCNQRKGQRTLEQAQMELRPQPAHSRPSTNVAGSIVSPPSAAGPVSPSTPAAGPSGTPGVDAAGTDTQEECSQAPDTQSVAAGPVSPSTPAAGPSGTPGVDAAGTDTSGGRPPDLGDGTTRKPGVVPPLVPPVDSGREAVLARTRASARGSGSGLGPGLGKGQVQGVGQGSASGPVQGDAPPDGRRRRRRGRGGKKSPGCSDPTLGSALGPAVGVAGVPPPTFHPPEFGSPWFGWKGPPSMVEDADCERHGLPEPCWKCKRGSEAGQ